jgi:hypothetical protein
MICPSIENVSLRIISHMMRRKQAVFFSINIYKSKQNPSMCRTLQTAVLYVNSDLNVKFPYAFRINIRTVWMLSQKFIMLTGKPEITSFNLHRLAVSSQWKEQGSCEEVLCEKVLNPIRRPGHPWCSHPPKASSFNHIGERSSSMQQWGGHSDYSNVIPYFPWKAYSLYMSQFNCGHPRDFNIPPVSV